MIALELTGKSLLPEKLTATCKADGEPVSGLLVDLTVKMRRKNDFHMVFGPSDGEGTITIHNLEILGQVETDQRLFEQDYADLHYFSGELLLEPMDQRSLESAYHAYEIYRAAVPFPSDYPDKLREAWETLNKRHPERLDVEVAVEPPPPTEPIPVDVPGLRVIRRSISPVPSPPF
jgi:hypothetical protein